MFAQHVLGHSIPKLARPIIFVYITFSFNVTDGVVLGSPSVAMDNKIKHLIIEGNLFKGIWKTVLFCIYRNHKEMQEFSKKEEVGLCSHASR